MANHLMVVQWDIELLNNGMYMIKNYKHKSSINHEPSPDAGEHVFGGDALQQWKIKEMRTKGGRYLYDLDFIQLCCILTET